MLAAATMTSCLDVADLVLIFSLVRFWIWIGPGSSDATWEDFAKRGGFDEPETPKPPSPYLMGRGGSDLPWSYGFI